MRRRFIADTFTPATGHPTHAALTGEQAVHLARVLRAQPGQIYDIVANGFLHRAEIISVRAASSENENENEAGPEVQFILHEELESDSALPIHLLLAVFKFDHFEWAIEKTTELGAARITPILARRTERHLALAAPKRVDRWRRIALESSKQSRRTDIPEISDPTPLAAALTRETAAPVRILLSETEQTLTLSSALTSAPPGAPGSTALSSTLGVRISLAGAPQNASEMWDRRATNLAIGIGPEGGWTPEEMALFTTHAWTHVTLGPRILRAETAAIAAIAIAAAHLAG